MSNDEILNILDKALSEINKHTNETYQCNIYENLQSELSTGDAVVPEYATAVANYMMYYLDIDITIPRDDVLLCEDVSTTDYYKLKCICYAFNFKIHTNTFVLNSYYVRLK